LACAVGAALSHIPQVTAAGVAVVEQVDAAEASNVSGAPARRLVRTADSPEADGTAGHVLATEDPVPTQTPATPSAAAVQPRPDADKQASAAAPNAAGTISKKSAGAQKATDTASETTVTATKASDTAPKVHNAALKGDSATPKSHAEAPKAAAAQSGSASGPTPQRSAPSTPVPAAPTFASRTENVPATGAAGPAVSQGTAPRRARRPSAMAAARKVQADIAASGQSVAIQPHEKSDDEGPVDANRVLEAAMDTAGAGIVAPLVQAVAAGSQAVAEGSQAAADQAGKVVVPSPKDISKMAHHVADGMVSAAKPAEVGQMVTASFGASFAAFLFVVLALGALSVAGSTVVQILREEFTEEGIKQKKKSNRIRNARRGSV